MEFKDVENVEYFAKGRRGLIYTGIYKNKKVIVKYTNPESKAIDRIKNEAEWLIRLNKHNVGPTLLFHSDDYLIYEFVEGEFIVDYIKNSSKEETIKVLKEVLNQCFIMDKMGINKQEMHRPIKHILISKDKIVQIDFERTRNTEKPKNLTQFCQFISWSELNDILKEKGINIGKNDLRPLITEYKKNINKENFNKILDVIR